MSQKVEETRSSVVWSQCHHFIIFKLFHYSESSISHLCMFFHIFLSISSYSLSWLVVWGACRCREGHSSSCSAVRLSIHTLLAEHNVHGGLEMWKNGEVWNFIFLRKLFRILERQEVAGAVPTDNSGMPKGRSWPCESKVDVFDTLCISVRRKQVPCGSSARFDVSVTWIASSCFNTRFEWANGLCTLVCFLALSACSELNSGSMSSSAETSPRHWALSTTGKDS